MIGYLSTGLVLGFICSLILLYLLSWKESLELYSKSTLNLKINYKEFKLLVFIVNSVLFLILWKVLIFLWLLIVSIYIVLIKLILRDKTS